MWQNRGSTLIAILQLFEKSIQKRSYVDDPSPPCFSGTLHSKNELKWKKKEKERDTQRRKDKCYRKQNQCFQTSNQCCSCLGIPLELLRTRIWSTEIKAKKNKESQSDKQPTRKKTQTNTDSLWNDWDKNQLFKLISYFFHQSKDEVFCVPNESWHPQFQYFLKVEEL